MSGRRLLSLVATLLLAANAGAAQVTFDARSAFLAAAGDVTTIDFGGLAAAGSVRAFNTAAGLTLADVQFVGFSGADNILNVIDDSFCCPAYRERGNNVASLASSVSTPTADARIEVRLPPGTFAVGMDLFTVTSRDTAGLLNDIIRIGVGAHVFDVPTVNISVGNGRVFFGLVSDTPFSRLSIAPSADNTAADVVDFSYAARPVPAPAALGLLLSALAWMRFWQGRRKLPAPG